MSASWFLVFDVFDLDLEIQINSIEQPIESNSGSGNVSYCRTPSFKDHTVRAENNSELIPQARKIEFESCK